MFWSYLPSATFRLRVAHQDSNGRLLRKLGFDGCVTGVMRNTVQALLAPDAGIGWYANTRNAASDTRIAYPAYSGSPSLSGKSEMNLHPGLERIQLNL